jgi:hypothetical protein
MRQIWNNKNTVIIIIIIVPVIKVILNYVGSSGTHPGIKCDCNVSELCIHTCAF